MLGCSGWGRSQLSLPEVNASVKVAPMDAPWYQKFWSYAGLGFIISVGYSASPILPSITPSSQSAVHVYAMRISIAHGQHKRYV